MIALQCLAVWVVFLSSCHLTVLGNEVQCTYKGAKAIFDPFSPDQRPGSDSIVSRFPCSFQMANYRCGRVQTLVLPENSMDNKGVTMLSDVTVIITPLRGNETSQQILKISVKKLRRYIARGNFTRSPWRWSYSGTKPKRRHRITGSYNETTRTAVISSGGMKVTFNGGRVLSARCSEPNFKVYGNYPEGVLCGSATSTWTEFNAFYNGLIDILPVCGHHRRHYHQDYIALALQKEYQTKPLCIEAAQIITSGTCTNLADKVHECSSLYEYRQPPSVTDIYGNCMRNKRIDPFKVYVACLRALCGSEGCKSADTCNTLREVEESCGRVRSFHTDISSLISKTQCPPPSETVSAVLEPGSSCNDSSVCGENALCAGDPAKCTCKPDHFPQNGACVLQLGAECMNSSECGLNAVCSGDPAICTCHQNYSSHNGVCGKRRYELCTTDTDCLPFGHCEKTAPNGPKCYCKSYTYDDGDGYCYQTMGRSCKMDWDCAKNAVCSNGSCTCRENFSPSYKKEYTSGQDTPDTFLTHCYLKIHEACNKTSDCGFKAECVGSPPRCTCLPGYIMDRGRCGKPVGAICDEQHDRECVLFATCRKGVCKCSYHHVADGQTCVQDVWCQYTLLRYKLELQAFPANGVQSQHSARTTYPCKYKFANIHCGDSQVLITVDHAMDRGYRFGRVYMGNITVNITRANSLGVSTSQINTLDIHKLLKMEETGDYNMTIWDWSFVGAEEPVGSDRIVGHYNRTEWAPYLHAGHVTVNVTFGGHILTIRCRDPNYSAIEEWPSTFCGGPHNTRIQNIPVDPRWQTTDSHHENGHAFDPDLALMLQNVPQSNPICEEISLMPSLACENYGEKRFKVDYSVDRFKDCMEDLKMDTLEFYVALTRTLCGTVPGTSAEVDTCNIFREVAGHCRTDTGELNMIQLLSMAGCNTTFSTTTTTTKAPRGGWK